MPTPADSPAERDDTSVPLTRRALLDGAVAAEPAAAASAPRRERVRESTRTWLDGSRTARRWDTELLGWTALCLGAAVIASVLLRTTVPGAAGTVLAGAALWIGMAVPTALAFRRGRPRGLLAFRTMDVVYALVLGIALRTVQGWLDLAAGGGTFPSYALGDGASTGVLWLTAVAGPVLLSPVIEEFLFHGVVLVAVYRIARRGLDGALLAIVASTAAFVAMHAITGGMTSWEQPVTWTLVGAALGTLVILTGRIWGAVLTHLVFNLSAALLALVGTALA
ncbi:CPBP family intramembrane glutamic endopeptidase [Microbacterium marinilacus]|uniref:CAAX prenyl protease 2/Lysostaphin resistance protein A-like domain-containing protein n=1 Tax=Microbacterium marinilacus TaxID=415209 RepID=A0ABP7BDK0_9MICO|nr:type II CAAX endopeptidase family protein [Microbacterium marinilacus]MBY0689428.1 CPBP family intramembrane metalloprotease [Microbacterium marinilacus]